MTIRISDRSFFYKTGFLQAMAVSTIELLHHSNFDKILGEKARQELHNDDPCCFEKILEAGPH